MSNWNGNHLEAGRKKRTGWGHEQNNSRKGKPWGQQWFDAHDGLVLYSGLNMTWHIYTVKILLVLWSSETIKPYKKTFCTCVPAVQVFLSLEYMYQNSMSVSIDGDWCNRSLTLIISVVFSHGCKSILLRVQVSNGVKLQVCPKLKKSLTIASACPSKYWWCLYGFVWENILKSHCTGTKTHQYNDK